MIKTVIIISCLTWGYVAPSNTYAVPKRKLNRHKIEDLMPTDFDMKKKLTYKSDLQN